MAKKNIAVSKPAAAVPATAKPEAPKPAAEAPKPKADPKPKAKADTYKIHINKTGRVCFPSESAERIGELPFVAVKIEGKLIRLQPTAKEIEGAVEVKYADKEFKVRPYISATKQMKPLGFDGSRSYDCEARPYGAAGFEFKLA